MTHFFDAFFWFGLATVLAVMAAFVIGVIWLIRKMLQQSYIDSLKDMLALVGMVSGPAWVALQALDRQEGSTGQATAFLQSIPWGLIWVVDSVLLAVLLLVIRKWRVQHAADN